MAVVSAVTRRQLAKDSVRCSIAWLVLYAVLGASGARIELSDLAIYWQIAPLDALERDPVQTLWYLHTQPPGWNALIAVLLRLSPVGLAASMHAVMVVSGAALCMSVHRIARAMGAGRRTAIAITVVATMNGQVMLSGFSVLYDLPVAALVTMVVALAVGPPGNRGVVMLSAVATVLAMTRTLYHPLWLFVVLVLVLMRARPHLTRAGLVATVAIPLIVVGGWMSKNYVQFGSPSLSSWTGMNLLRSVEPAVDDDDLETLRAEGVISGVATTGHFVGYERYAGVMPPCTARDDVLVLSYPTKGGSPVAGGFGTWIPDNFNYECFLPVFRQAGEDARAIIRERPGDWLQARAWAVSNWFAVPEPETDSPVLRSVRAATRVAFVVVPNPVSATSWGGHPFWAPDTPLSATVMVLTCVALVGSLRRVLGRSGSGYGTTVPGAAYGLIAWTVAWTVAAGILLELGEQARFRMATDPLVIGVGGAMVAGWIGRRVSRSRDRSESAC